MVIYLQYTLHKYSPRIDLVIVGQGKYSKSWHCQTSNGRTGKMFTLIIQIPESSSHFVAIYLQIY